jgi:hypothetical protein
MSVLKEGFVVKKSVCLCCACFGVQGCQIFLGATCQKGKNKPKTIKHKTYQMARKYTFKTIKNRPTGLKIYPHLPLQDPLKFTQIDIFGFKINHLATLSGRRVRERERGERGERERNKEREKERKRERDRNSFALSDFHI